MGEKLQAQATMADFKAKVATGIVVVDFYATWCGPCNMISPLVEKLEKDRGTFKLLKVDVDECEEIAAELKISAMPTFYFYKDGEKVGTVVGASIEKVKAELDKIEGKK